MYEKLVIACGLPSSNNSKSSAVRSVTCLPSFITTASTWTRLVVIFTTSCGAISGGGCICEGNFGGETVGSCGSCPTTRPACKIRMESQMRLLRIIGAILSVLAQKTIRIRCKSHGCDMKESPADCSFGGRPLDAAFLFGVPPSGG